ncbi:hypothetical protein PJWF_00016 [Achromobacter phage JWF]|uniref:hypothetical protein n=1 Tax=Achromobacter phage JWF TaxID=1589748 RepID=UPI000588E76B|nr:hypothetical protein AXJ13_gp016 [Achromobacter phage JWF]AJD82910.1 hypothetical protein PJWF_00016 [Achromobacter phage JWF]
MSNVSNDPYLDHMASVRAFCNRMLQTGNLGLDVDTTGKGPLVDFDSYGDSDDLPPKDLIGPASFSLDIDEHLVSITVMIGICTQNDLNSQRLNKAISQLLKSLLPTKEIPVIRANNGERIGGMKVGQNVRVLPVSGEAGRNMKFVAVELHSTVTLNLSDD